MYSIFLINGNEWQNLRQKDFRLWFKICAFRNYFHLQMSISFDINNFKFLFIDQLKVELLIAKLIFILFCITFQYILSSMTQKNVKWIPNLNLLDINAVRQFLLLHNNSERFRGSDANFRVTSKEKVAHFFQVLFTSEVRPGHNDVSRLSWLLATKQWCKL